MKTKTRRFLGNLWITLVAWAIALIPLWFYLGVRALANPENSWQEIVFAIVGIKVLAGIQIVLVLLVLAYTFLVWFD